MMRIVFFISLISVLFFLHTIAFAALNKDKLNVQDGLAHNSVQSIAQDKYGFIWFGTVNGLSRYDGYNFVNYHASTTDTNTLYNNRISLLYLDDNKNLWVSAFDTVICKYNYETDNFSRYNKSSLSQEVLDSTNRKINLSRFKAQAKGKEFIIENNQLLKIKNLKSGASIKVQELVNTSFKKEDFNCLFIDNTNVLWMGTHYDGAIKLDLMGNQFKNIQTYITKNSNNVLIGIRCIYKDEEQLWLGTFENGLSIVDLSTNLSKHYKKSSSANLSLASDKLRIIYKDFADDIWIGYNTGVDKIDKRKKHLFPYTPRDSITRYDKEVWTQKKYLPNRNFQCIAEDEANNLLLGTYNGIFKYRREEDTFKYIDLSAFAKNSLITCIYSDSNNNLWFGSEKGGIACFKKDAETGLNSDTIYFNFRHSNKNALPDDRIFSFCEDGKGYFWVGTVNGLCRINIDKENAEIFNENSGLSDAGIYCLLLDKHSQLWMTHKKGVSKINTNTLSINNYTIPAIDNGAHFLKNSGYYHKENDALYFGHTAGYITFKPKGIQDNPFRPVVRITQIKIDNRVVKVNETINNRIILNSSAYNTNEIELTHKERSISIEFAGMHFANPELNQFEYMLQGFDENPVVVNAQNRVATYSNLKPGTYNFKVKAANASGLWSSNQAQLQITVLAPWWKTWKALLIYIITISGITYFFIRISLTLQKYRYQYHLEKVKAERNEELVYLKTSFFTNVSHELRTPLTLIIDPIKRLIEKEKDINKQKYYEPIYSSSKRLLKLVNQLLDFRKLEEKRMTVNLKPLDIVNLINEDIKLFDHNTKNKKLKFKFLTDIKKEFVLIDSDKIDSILFNLFSNAVKYATSDTEILVALTKVHKTSRKNSEEQKWLQFKIENKVNKDLSMDIERLFEPFYREYNNELGTGLGLAVTKQLVELLNGSIHAEKKENIISFTVLLPVQKTSDSFTKESSDANIESPYFENEESIAYEGSKVVINNDSLPLILLVDDHVEIRKYIADEFKKHFNFIEAEDGKEALKLVEKKMPDLIISDIMMPQMNGFELCSAIKKDFRTCHLPVLLLTAGQSEESRTEGYELGADGYLVKPFSSIVLKARIENLLQSRNTLANVFKSDTITSQKKYLNEDADCKFLSNIRALIVNSNGVYNVDSLAESVSLSRTQLYRKIKASTGKTASEFINEVRLNYAAELLVSKGKTISEIAFYLGYSETSNFSRSFSRYFGMSPKKYLETKKMLHIE